MLIRTVLRVLHNLELSLPYDGPQEYACDNSIFRY